MTVVHLSNPKARHCVILKSNGNNLKNDRQPIAVMWFRRDLRIGDNTALYAALNSGLPVLPLFIFDPSILKALPADDARVNYIYDNVKKLHLHVRGKGGSLLCKHGIVKDIFDELLRSYRVKDVYVNKDYEPDAILRDEELADLLAKRGTGFHACKDQVIFEEDEVIKQDGLPYTVFTPYKNKWLETFKKNGIPDMDMPPERYYPCDMAFPEKNALGIKQSDIRVKAYTLEHLDRYEKERDIPAKDAGSYLGPHLRFGTVSIREIISGLRPRHDMFLSELIWREFFMQILFHYPRAVHSNFRKKYDGIIWRNNEKDFIAWCRGETGYPLVDAGMRQLNASAYMHNRVRMIAASFLCKHLLIDWRWGERYFAEKLLDFELSSNNGNWQWAAGTGCDAAPYFRVFNPLTQQEKFDKDLTYIRTWIPDYQEDRYIAKIIDHKTARERTLTAYKKALRV
ncbi:MAG: DNA photolyase family protein [FCB group bacterium]|nr:DNA photolyase family protein [FCB group bacterium]